jgi:hypothetical protein
MNFGHKHATDYASTIESDVPIVVQYPGRVSEEALKPFTVIGNE